MVAMLRPVQPYVEYALNQDYIAEFLCINKDKPKLQCNGKCHLVKELEKQQEQDPVSALSVNMENYPIGFVDIFQLKNPKDYTYKAPLLYSYNSLYNFHYSEESFQPPDFV